MKRLFTYTFTAFLWLTAAGSSTAQTIVLQQQNDYTIGVAGATPRYGVGDVNNDGRPDLVTLNKGNVSAQGPISVFLNDGAGGFAAPINITDTTNLSPNAVVIGDFNEDGNPDLAIGADGLSTGINIRLGNGTGNFPTGTYIAERGSPGITSADYNNDGNLDVAICNNVNELRVLSGTGAGTFGAAVPFTTGNACNELLTSDFNVDGRPDIVTASRLATNSVQVFINNGTSFNAPVNNQVSGAYTLVTADFNRDCIPDLASTQFSGSGIVYILIGSGTGTFTSTSIAVTNTPGQLSVGDFNRDKKVDLAVRRNTLTPGANNLSILPGNGSGGFGTPFEAAIANPITSTDMRLATLDANRDGRSDLIVGRNGGFLLFHGNSALSTRTEHDFDGDLRADLSVFRPSTGTWYVQRTTQGFAAQQWGISTDRLVPGDYDADGRTDYAVWREGSLAYLYVLNSSNATVRIEQFGQTGDDPVIMADFDGDARADAAVYRDGATTRRQSNFYYRGSLNNPNGDITFVPWGNNGDRPVRGDFDGDGRADAAVFRPADSIWYVRRSSDAQVVYQSWGLATDRRVTGDYDGDGRTDFAVFRDGNWYILNSSTGIATYRQWGQSSDVLAPADYNGDGRTEIAIFRPSEQRWYAPQCGDVKLHGPKFGTTGDTAVPSAFVP